MAGRYEQLELKDVDEVDNELSTATRSSTAGAWLFSAMRNVHPAHMWHRLKQVLLLWTLVSLLLYSWLVFFSERVSTSYVSPRLLGATNILWLTAHRGCARPWLAQLSNLAEAFQFDSRRRVHVLRAEHLQPPQPAYLSLIHI